MKFLKSIVAKTGNLNSSLAQAHNAWKDEGLNVREKNLNVREALLKEREEAALSSERRRILRRSLYLILLLSIATVAYQFGFYVGSRKPDGPETATIANSSDSTVPASGSSRPMGQSQLSEPFEVSSDPGVDYNLISWKKLSNGNVEATTERRGPSGTSYARREIDCAARMFRYLGEGSTLQEAQEDRSDPDMSPLTDQSISSIAAAFICAKAN